MFDKEEYRKSLKKMLPNMSDGVIDHQVEIKAKNHATLKKGPNIVHLDYYSGIISDGEIVEIEKTLKGTGLELSRYDKTGSVYANLQDFSLQIAIAFGPTLVVTLMQSAVWDAIKAVTKISWESVRSKLIRKSSTGELQSPNFGMRIIFENHQIKEFQLPAGLSAADYDKAMDKIFDFISSQRELPAQSQEMPDFMKFDTESAEWGKVDVIAAMRSLAERRRSQNGPTE
jgi:hypothetical protein